MENNQIRRMERWPTGVRVGANLRDLRKRRGKDLKDVSADLAEIDWPINVNGLSKMENGSRRVDVDDLIALALVLRVTPDRILMPASAGRTDPAELIPGIDTTAGRLWAWAVGDEQIGSGGESKAVWRALVRPDAPEIPGIRLPSIDREGELYREAVSIFERLEHEGHNPEAVMTLWNLTHYTSGGSSDG